jgi:hypothetical protein
MRKIRKRQELGCKEVKLKEKETGSLGSAGVLNLKSLEQRK